MPINEVLRMGRYVRTVPARSVLCFWANRELGIGTVELAKKLKIAQPTVTQSIARGEKIVAEKQLRMTADGKR
jgi:putative transposase